MEVPQRSIAHGVHSLSGARSHLGIDCGGAISPCGCCQPAIRVTEVDPKKPDNRDWKQRKDMERDLREKGALRIVESLRIASLRVTLPQTNLCYGIEWKVPEVHFEMDPTVYQVQRRLFEMEEGVRRTRLAPLLTMVAQMTREGTIAEIAWTVVAESHDLERGR